MGLTKLAIKNYITVFILVFITFVVGLQSYIALPREGPPDIKIPVVVVVVPYFGVSAKDIETLVTIPLEKELKDLDDVKDIDSTSAESASNIVIEFEPNVNIDDALVDVREKVDRAKVEMPSGIEEPVIQEVSFSDQPIMFVNIGGDMSLTQLKQVAEDLKDRIEVVPGVIEVELTGGLEREIQVVVDPDRLDYYKLSLNAIVGALQNQNVNVPGGPVDVGNLKYLVRVPGEFTSVQEIEDIVVKSPRGNPVYLRDVAEVVDGFEDRSTYSRLNGNEAVTLSIKKRAGENLVGIAASVKELIETERQTYPDLTYSITNDQSIFVRDMLVDLQNNMITAFLLVSIVLFFALGARSASLVGMSIPLAMLMSMTVLQFMGTTLNFMVLFALIVALGMLVDNSLVIVEGAYRLMQEGTPRVEASIQASKELGAPLISSTMTTLAAFVPLMFWPGVTGEFMSYFPLLLIIALSSSLFIGIVINPVFTSRFMKLRKPSKRKPQGSGHDGPIIQFYQRILTVAVRHRYITIALTFGLFVGTIATYGQLGKGVIFFSQEDPSVYTIEVRAPEGTQVEITNEIAKQVEGFVEKYREGNIKNVITNVGSPAQSGEPGGGGGGGSGYSHIANITLDFENINTRKRSSKAVAEDIRSELKVLSGVEVKLNEQSNGPPAGSPVAVKLTGISLNELERLTEEIKDVMVKVPGVVDLRDNFENNKPELVVEVDRAKASMLKLNPQSIGNTLRIAINGLEASDYREFDEEYDIRVRLKESARSSIEDVANLNITNSDDALIPLKSVALVETRNGAGAIRRTDQKRTVTISSNVEGRLANDVLMDVSKALEKEIKLPPGYQIKYGGEQEEQQEAQAFLSKAFLMAVMFIFLILVTQFNSFILPMIILSTVILSIMGVLMGQMITGTPFSIILSGLGVISLAGIVVNNGIVMIDYIELLKKQGYSAYDAVIQAGIVRLRPVFLTAFTTFLSLVPALVGISLDFTNFTIGATGETSRLFTPLSIALAYGLMISTVLTLVFVPALYMVIDHLRNWGHEMSVKMRKRLSKTSTAALDSAPSITGVAGNDSQDGLPMDPLALRDAYEAHESHRFAQQHYGQASPASGATALQAPPKQQADAENRTDES